MITRIAVIWAAASIIACNSFAGENASPEVKIAAQGLRVVRPAPLGNDDLRAFNWMPGTSVALVIGVADGGLVALDDEASKLTSFVDDQGKDLTNSIAKDGFGGERAGFGMLHKVSKDGKLCSAEVTAPGLPTRGAKTVTVGGNVVLRIAKQQKDSAADKVALKAGTKFTAGAVPLTITAAGKPNWGGDEAALAVTIQARQSADNIARIEFFDAGGNPIKTELNGTGSSSFGNVATVEWTYHLKSKVETAKVVIWYWTDMKKVTVPFRLTVGAGL